ncbi:AAA family ATPase [uncultured Chryseobacterium sp.]|uniref:AAA family ATPase n=1 Tax=uncultured Chryseobacterium sp. TaxID=259322 RepID=UPI0025E4C9C1|nr:AAA family ATPase [uncultured Chryseobacterium sp.]
MKITKLHIYNYKNLNVELTNTSSIIALIGNNGSGKSNILEAISTIFFHLFQKKEKDIPFNFLIEYKFGGNQTVCIEKRNSTIHFKVDNNPRADIQQFLPKQIVALYSGEENRLWKKSYEPLYMAYVNNINKSETSGLGEYNIVPKMLYINKFYWHISLLCLLISDAPDTKMFCEQTLGINKINSIKFDFKTANYANYTNSSVKTFINLIDKKSEYSIDELKKIISECPFPLDEVYKYLYLAFTPDKKKMLENITIKYNDNNLDIEDFSEGEKKMLLIKAALEFAGLEDSLFLLDEPDAHIHLNNKIQIKNVFKEYLDTRQVILTTHSPTLTDTLDEESLFMLNTGNLVHHKKQEILESVSGEFWNKFQQNAFIASKKPIILLVEGKHDKAHIHNAFEALKEDYQQLDFQCFILNGESKIQPFLSGLYESDFYTDKLYVGIYDNDGAGDKSFNNGFEKVKDNFKKLKESNGKENNSYFAIKLPKPNEITCDCTMETLYELERFEEAIQSATKSALGHLKNKSIDDIAKGIKEQAKNILSENSQTFNIEDFKNFRALFDLILEISDYRNSLIKGIKQEKNTQDIPETTKETSARAEKYIEIYTDRRSTEVNGLYYNDKKVTIQNGSKLSIDVVDSYAQKTVRNKELKKIADLQENCWVLKEDKTFNSVSGAINYATGGNMNGWAHWIIKENKKPLETIREK